MRIEDKLDQILANQHKIMTLLGSAEDPSKVTFKQIMAEYGVSKYKLQLIRAAHEWTNYGKPGETTTKVYDRDEVHQTMIEEGYAKKEDKS